MCSTRLLFVVGILCLLWTCASDDDPTPDEETLVIKTYQEMLDCHDNKNYDFNKAKKTLVGKWNLVQKRLIDYTLIGGEDVPDWSMTLNEDWSGDWLWKDSLYTGRWVISGDYKDQIGFDFRDQNGKSIGMVLTIHECEDQLVLVEQFAPLGAEMEWYVKE